MTASLGLPPGQQHPILHRVIASTGPSSSPTKYGSQSGAVRSSARASSSTSGGSSTGGVSSRNEDPRRGPRRTARCSPTQPGSTGTSTASTAARCMTPTVVAGPLLSGDKRASQRRQEGHHHTFGHRRLRIESRHHSAGMGSHPACRCRAGPPGSSGIRAHLGGNNGHDSTHPLPVLSAQRAGPCRPPPPRAPAGRPSTGAPRRGTATRTGRHCRSRRRPSDRAGSPDEIDRRRSRCSGCAAPSAGSRIGSGPSRAQISSSSSGVISSQAVGPAR